MKIYVATILGSPAADCAHFGICKVDELQADDWNAFQPQHFRHVKAILSLSHLPGRLHFEFPFLGMRTETRKAFFSPNGFKIDSPGYLPDQLAITIGTGDQIIMTGLYPLVFSAESVMLDVEIRKEVLLLESVDLGQKLQVLSTSGTASNKGSISKSILRVASES